jgi:hypothetical protein
MLGVVVLKQLERETKFTSHVLIGIEMPSGLDQFKLPPGVDERLQDLLDRQDRGESLSPGERREAEGLVDLAEALSLLRTRAQHTAGDLPTLNIRSIA